MNRFVDLGELVFRFLGVYTDGCRRRFVCELDFRARANPITRLLFSLVGRNFFEQYRVLDDGVEQPKKFRDCARIYNECEDAEKYAQANSSDETDVNNFGDDENTTEEHTESEE